MNGSSFTFESRFPDGSPRRFAGTWRPTRDEAEEILAAMTSDERNAFYTSYPSHWGDFTDYALHLGRFDRPIYHVEEFERA